MKKIFIAVALFALTTGNIEAANYFNTKDVTIENRINELSKSIATTSRETPFYTLNITEAKTDSLKRFLKLSDEQRDMLFDVHKVINEEFDKLNTIDDPARRERMFIQLIHYWRKHSNLALITEDANDPTVYETSRKQFIMYWACVSNTLRNRGIIDNNSQFVQPDFYVQN